MKEYGGRTKGGESERKGEEQKGGEGVQVSQEYNHELIHDCRG